MAIYLNSSRIKKNNHRTTGDSVERSARLVEGQNGLLNKILVMMIMMVTMMVMTTVMMTQFLASY